MGMKLSDKVTTPIQSKYSPEVDMSCELVGTDGQEIIGMLQWEVEIGIVDIIGYLGITCHLEWYTWNNCYILWRS